MKKIFKVLPPVMMLALIGSAIGLSLQHQSITMKAEAYFQATGTYNKVSTHESLQNGDTVLIASTNSNHVVSACGGNPGYIYGNDDAETIQYSEDRNTITLTNTYATEFTVVINENGSYAFKSTFAVNGFSFDVHTGYISCFQHNEFSNYRSIERFLWKVGHREGTPTDPKSSWTLTTDEYSGIIHAENVSDNDVHLAYYPLNDEDMLYNGRNGFYLYKKINDVKYSATVTQDPGKTSYNNGDTIDLSGLIIEIDSNAYDHPITVSYNGNEDKFFFNENATAGSGQNLFVTYIDGAIKVDFIVALTVSDRGATYTKVTSSLNDYRGQYVIASDGNDSLHVDDDDYPYYHAMDGYEGGDLEAYIDGNVIKFSSASLPFEGLILLEKIEGYYRMFVDNGTRHYIHVDSSTGELSVDYDSLEYQDKGQTAPDNTPLEVVFDTDHVYLKIANSDKVLKRSGDFKFTNGSGNVAYLFKRQSLTAAEESALNNFLHSFVDDTLICDYNGQTDDINLGNKWATLATKFNALPVSAQGALANVTYDHNQENENSIKDLIDRYDYIVSKYPSCSDFMQRGSTFIANLQQRINISEISRDFGSNNAAVVVAIVCSLLAVSCLALFIYRKKKLER